MLQVRGAKHPGSEEQLFACAEMLRSAGSA
jgi:hypothetical protein